MDQSCGNVLGASIGKAFRLKRRPYHAALRNNEAPKAGDDCVTQTRGLLGDFQSSISDIPKLNLFPIDLHLCER